MRHLSTKETKNKGSKMKTTTKNAKKSTPQTLFQESLMMGDQKETNKRRMVWNDSFLAVCYKDASTPTTRWKKSRQRKGEKGFWCDKKQNQGGEGNYKSSSEKTLKRPAPTFGSEGGMKKREIGKGILVR